MILLPIWQDTTSSEEIPTKQPHWQWSRNIKELKSKCMTETKVQKANQNQCGSVGCAVIGSTSRPSCCKCNNPISHRSQLRQDKNKFGEQLNEQRSSVSVSAFAAPQCLASNQMNPSRTAQSWTFQLHCVVYSRTQRKGGKYNKKAVIRHTIDRRYSPN